MIGKDQKCVRLHAKVLASPKVKVERAIELAQRVLDVAKIGIRIDLASTEGLDLPHLRRLPIGSCDKNVPPTPEQEELFSHRNGVKPNELVAYFVRITDPPNDGCSIFPAGAPGFVVARSANRWTLAHELAHVLGLEHVNSNLRLMFRFGTSGVVDPPPNLNATEREKIFNSKFILEC